MDPYTSEERDAMAGRLRRGPASRPACPRCGCACAVIRTRARDDVAYVRDRVLVRCARCRRSFSFEADGDDG